MTSSSASKFGAVALATIGTVILMVPLATPEAGRAARAVIPTSAGTTTLPAFRIRALNVE